MRVQYPGAIYHVVSRGDQRDDISLEDVNRHDLEAYAAELSSRGRV